MPAANRIIRIEMKDGSVQNAWAGDVDIAPFIYEINATIGTGKHHNAKLSVGIELVETKSESVTTKPIKENLSHRADHNNRARAKFEAQREVIKSNLIEDDKVIRVANKALAKIKQAGDQGMTRTDLNRAIAGREKQFLNDAVDYLIEHNLVAQTEDELTTGKITTTLTFT